LNLRQDLSVGVLHRGATGKAPQDYNRSNKLV